MQHMSKSQFKPKAFEIMRFIEKTGKSVILTDHGQPVLELRVYHSQAKHEVDPWSPVKGECSKV